MMYTYEVKATLTVVNSMNGLYYASADSCLDRARRDKGEIKAENPGRCLENETEVGAFDQQQY